MVRIITALTLLAVAIAGCGDAGDEALETTTTATTQTSSIPTTTAAGGTESCANADAGYSVEYPAGWSTNVGEVTAGCRYFNPRPFELPRDTEVFNLAVAIGVDPVPFETVAEPYDEQEETTVAGRQAVRVETVSSGEALLPAGVRSYRYAVDLDGSTLVAVTYDIDQLDYEANKNVLDQMMESLRLDGGGDRRAPER